MDRVKHPILGLLVTMWMYFRLLRCQIIGNISYDINYDYDFSFEIHHPILFLRLLILLINTGLVITLPFLRDYQIYWDGIGIFHIKKWSRI